MRKYYTAILLLLVCVTLACNTTIKQPVFIKATDTKLANVGLDKGSATLTSKLIFRNDNSFGVEAKEAKLKLYIEGTYVADITQPKTVQVPASAEFAVPLTAQVDMEKSMGSLMGLLGKNSIAYKLEGTIKVGKKGVFISVPILVQDVYGLNL